MKISTLCVLLLMTVCCSILVDVAFGLDNEVEMSEDFLRDNRAIRDYIKKADNKAKAFDDIHDRLLAAGMKVRAEKFMERVQAYLEKHRESRKGHHGRKDLPRQREDYVKSFRGRGGRRHKGRRHGGYGRRGGYGGYRG
ncbi:uncharacterized protein LOC118427453 [Branchiostoma floridae]|uniref:Uncharacterized protein LOC118427453 n=1 Tax=Branchiostoma floridae TaxID=7739 RepID=A0A9J7M228_BRAFL|nr:uncharacterized protein LOC118427453 [Branchiostoma floridae]